MTVLILSQPIIECILNPKDWSSVVLTSLKPRSHEIARSLNRAISHEDLLRLLGFIYDLPLMLFGKMHSMICCDIIRTVM